MKGLYFAFIPLMVITAIPAFADSAATATMHVTLEVVKSCSLEANDLNFDRHESSEASAISASTQLNVTCTNGTPFTLSAKSSDSDDSGTFWLKPDDNAGSGTHIAYRLYASENQSQQITGQGGLTGTGNGQVQSETVYGVINAGALNGAPAGLYSDNVTLSVVY